MKDFDYKLSGILSSNRDGSYSTQTARKYVLSQVGEDLHALGYKVNNPATLKPKHTYVLVNYWQSQGLSAGTMKNRMTHLRWLAKKTNNQFIRKGNDVYEIARRRHINTVNRAHNYRPQNIDNIRDERVRMAAELQREFGLRREEAIKFRPSFADRRTHIELKHSWTKGGRGRIVLIRNPAQRAVLDKAHRLFEQSNMMRNGDRYSTAKSRFDFYMQDADVGPSHGARFAYAQQRYLELTGFECAYNGGLRRSQLSGQRLKADTLAREIISSELGHGRIKIVSVYIGG